MAKTDWYIEELKDLQKGLFKKIENVFALRKDLSDTDLMMMAKEFDFFDQLERSGYNKIFIKMQNQYEDEVASIFSQLGSARRSAISVNAVSVMDDLIRFELDYLSESVRQYAKGLKTAMLRGIATGQSDKVIIQAMTAEFGAGKGISSRSAQSLLGDAFARFSNSTTAKAYEMIPEQKFIYVGPNDQVTRVACQNVLSISMSNNGLTLKEINDLANGSDFFGFSDRGGFNCRHDWVPI
jgi:hypothetical protein